MPIIFAQALMFIPLMLAGFKSDTLSGIGAAFSDITGFWYNFVYGLMIVLFTYFYTAVIINPTQMAEELRKNGGFIPGIKPGRKTVEHLDSIGFLSERVSAAHCVWLTDEEIDILADKKVVDLAPLERIPCFHLRRELYINVDGNVPACMYSRYKSNICDLKVESIQKVIEKLRELYKKNTKKDYIDFCSNCNDYYHRKDAH